MNDHGGAGDSPINFAETYKELQAEFPHATRADIAVLTLTEVSHANPALQPWLERYRVDFNHALNMLDIITCHGIAIYGRRFDIVSREEGDAAVVFPVVDETGKAVDLIAFRPDAPQQWWLLLDEGAVLGAVNIDNPASYVDGPLKVCPTPLDWLRAGCSGVCILNAFRARQILRKAIGPIAATDLQHAKRLARALAPEITPDRILIPRARAA